MMSNDVKTQSAGGAGGHGPPGGGLQSYDGIAAVCRLRLLQFALPEGLDGVQQSGAISIRSVRGGRGGRLRRAGGGVQRRCGWRVGLGAYVKGRIRAPNLWPCTQKHLPVVDGGVGEDGQVGGELAPEPERRHNW